jgi:hypothetical protein
MFRLKSPVILGSMTIMKDMVRRDTNQDEVMDGNTRKKNSIILNKLL